MTSKAYYSEPIDGPEIHGITAEEIHTLGKQCAEAKNKAYCPYSNFRVGCALLIQRPLFSPFITGSNVENASYPVGTCAERVALGTAVASGARAGDFKALAVSTDLDEPCSPCGMCRQFIREFCPETFPVFMFDKRGDFVVKTLGELLPMSFGPEALPKQQQRVEPVADQAGSRSSM